MAWKQLTAQQRAQLAAMQFGQVTLFTKDEEYALEFEVESLGGRQLKVATTVLTEDGIPALARLRQIVLALDALPGLTVLAWKRTKPPLPADSEAACYSAAVPSDPADSGE